MPMFSFADEDMPNTDENGQKPQGKFRLFDIGQHFVVLNKMFCSKIEKSLRIVKAELMWRCIQSYRWSNNVTGSKPFVQTQSKKKKKHDCALGHRKW